MLLERSNGAWADDGLHAEFVEGPNVGSIVDLVGWDCVASSVSGKKGDLSTVNLGEHDGIAWRAVRSVHLDFRHIFEKAVKARSTKYSNFNLRH